MTIEELEIKYEDLDDEELLDELIDQAQMHMKYDKEAWRKINAIKNVILNRIGK